MVHLNTVFSNINRTPWTPGYIMGALLEHVTPVYYQSSQATIFFTLQANDKKIYGTNPQPRSFLPFQSKSFITRTEYNLTFLHRHLPFIVEGASQDMDQKDITELVSTCYGKQHN